MCVNVLDKTNLVGNFVWRVLQLELQLLHALQQLCLEPGGGAGEVAVSLVQTVILLASGAAPGGLLRLQHLVQPSGFLLLLLLMLTTGGGGRHDRGVLLAKELENPVTIQRKHLQNNQLPAKKKYKSPPDEIPDNGLSWVVHAPLPHPPPEQVPQLPRVLPPGRLPHQAAAQLHRGQGERLGGRAMAGVIKEGGHLALEVGRELRSYDHLRG